MTTANVCNLDELRPWLLKTLKRIYKKEINAYTNPREVVQRLDEIREILTPRLLSPTTTKIVHTKPLVVIQGEVFLELASDFYRNIKHEGRTITVDTPRGTFSATMQANDNSWDKVVIEAWLLGTPRTREWYRMGRDEDHTYRMAPVSDGPYFKPIRESRDYILYEIYKLLMPDYTRAIPEVDLHVTEYFQHVDFKADRIAFRKRGYKCRFEDSDLILR